MTTKIFTFVLASFITTLSFGQSTPSAQTADHLFVSLKEEFTVRTPCKLTEVNSEREWSIYKCQSGTNWFFVTSNIDETTSQLAEIKKQSPSEIKPTTIAFGKLERQRYSFADYDGNFQNVVAINTSNRFYLFHCVSENEKDPDVLAFLESISMDRLASVIRKTSSKPKTIVDKLKKPALSDSKYMSRERASLLERLYAKQTYVAKPDQTTPFKLLRTIQPAYTPLAVLYEVEGMVKVRATFLASGHIGAVTPVTKLPFGLTANAIAAAKFISFEPKVDKGEALSIIRTIEYQFSIL